MRLRRNTKKDSTAIQHTGQVLNSKVMRCSPWRSGELLNVMDSVRGMEVQVESLWAALPPIARRAYLMELIGAEMQSTNSIEAVHTTRKEISDALDAAVADGRTSG